MITEDYVSFEVAKLLKEKGFCLSTKTAYNQQGIFNLCEGFTNGVKSLCNADFDRYYNSDFISAPTLQMAMKWLREVHIIIVIQPEFFNAESECSAWGVDIWCDDNYEKIQGNFPTYEEAVNEGIKYCLTNLI